MDQLHLHFMNSINSEAFLVLLKHVEVCITNHPTLFCLPLVTDHVNRTVLIVQSKPAVLGEQYD
jgi:hypothetical protein